MCFSSTFSNYICSYQHPNHIIWFLFFPDDNGVNESSSFLQEEIISLKGLELIAEQVEPVQPAPESSEPAVEIPSAAVKEQKAGDKKAVKPKWLRMWYFWVQNWAISYYVGNTSIFGYIPQLYRCLPV